MIFSYIVYKSRAHRDRVNEEGDERSAPCEHDEESQGHAVRRQAYDLRWVQDTARLIAGPPPSSQSDS